VRLFYFATVQKAVALTLGQQALLSPPQHSSVAAAALVDDCAFAARLAFLLRPLLARTEMLLDLLRLPAKYLPEIRQPPPSDSGPLSQAGSYKASPQADR
jgi:hypothetical protein